MPCEAEEIWNRYWPHPWSQRMDPLEVLRPGQRRSLCWCSAWSREGRIRPSLGDCFIFLVSTFGRWLDWLFFQLNLQWDWNDFEHYSEVRCTLPNGSVLDDPEQIVFKLPGFRVQNHNLQWLLKCLGMILLPYFCVPGSPKKLSDYNCDVILPVCRSAQHDEAAVDRNLLRNPGLHKDVSWGVPQDGILDFFRLLWFLPAP